MTIDLRIRIITHRRNGITKYIGTIWWHKIMTEIVSKYIGTIWWHKIMTEIVESVGPSIKITT